MASALEQRYNHILSDAITSILKPAGFRRRGRVWTRQLESLAWIVDVQRSRYNTREEVGFTLNCGVFVPRVMSLYGNYKEPTSPTTIHSCIEARIGMLAEDQRDRWWMLQDLDPVPAHDKRIINDIRERIVVNVLPLLARFPSTCEVAEYLEGASLNHDARFCRGTQSISFGCAAIIHLIRGEPEACRGALARAVRTASGTLGAAHLLDLQQRLLSDGLPV